MDSTIVKKTSKSITIQVSIPVEGKDMLTKEEAIQIALNFLGKEHTISKGSYIFVRFAFYKYTMPLRLNVDITAFSFRY
jgi:hypothetical protein